MEDKKRQQNQAIEKEHQQIMAQKAEMAISKRMEASDPAVTMTMTMWGPTIVVIS